VRVARAHRQPPGRQPGFRCSPRGMRQGIRLARPIGHLVRVEWLKTRPTEDAAWQSGLFTNQVPVCKLRDRDTIEFLEDAFALKEQAPSEVATSAAT